VLHVVHVVCGDLHRYQLMGRSLDSEVKLNVPPPLIVLPLDPVPRLLDLYLDVVDCDADWLVRLPEAPVVVDGFV